LNRLAREAIRGFASALIAVAVAAPTTAQGDWMLWVESPEGSDLWTRVRIGPPTFAAEEECHRRARELNVLEAAFAKSQDAQAHDVFACLPDSVDPRPEGALLHDRRPKESSK
jgi:hypothetical protein